MPPQAEGMKILWSVSALSRVPPAATFMTLVLSSLTVMATSPLATIFLRATISRATSSSTTAVNMTMARPMENMLQP